MEKERFLFVEVTVKGEKDWKAIHMCGSMADAVPVADAVHNPPICSTRPSLFACARRGQGFGGLTDGKERRLHGKSILAK